MQTKLFLSLALLLAALAVFGTASLALEGAPEAVTPGVEVLANRLSIYKTGATGDAISFSDEDFSGVFGYLPLSVTVVTLPPADCGVLKLGAVDVQAGEEIGALTYRYLRFVPKDATVEEAFFTVRASDAAYAGAVVCRVFWGNGENHTPVALTRSIQTYTGTQATAVLPAYDADGDALCYTLETRPENGTAVLAPDGNCVYTPCDGAKDDSFSYTVTDTHGNRSAAAAVSVTVEERKTDTVYADMDGSPALSAVTAMAEESLMVGDSIGGVMLFRPDAELSRGDFLMTAMLAAGIRPTAANAAGFADDDEIPAHLLPYAASARESGILCGVPDDNGTMLCAARAITRREAYAVTVRLLPPSLRAEAECTALAVFAQADGKTPDEAILTGAAVLSRSALPCDEPLTRAEAAVLLAALLEHQAH